jgi:hypothetical protein
LEELNGDGNWIRVVWNRKEQRVLAKNSKETFSVTQDG